MKYPKLKTAVDAERKKRKLIEKILGQKNNNFSKMSLLSFSISDLEKLVRSEPGKKPEKSDS